MAYCRTLAVVLTAVALSVAGASQASSPAGRVGPDLVTALQGGGYVIYFRHAATDFSQTDTDTQTLADCSTQRNLVPEGRADARAIGRAFRALRIPVGQVLASKYCRTRQPAPLASGPVLPPAATPTLPSAGSEQEEARRVEALRRLLGTPPSPGKNRGLVAHLFNLQAAADASLEEGEAAVFRPRGGKRFRLVATVLPEQWTALARSLQGATLRVREYPLPSGKGPHDVAPARDGGVWYTAQDSGG